MIRVRFVFGLIALVGLSLGCTPKARVVNLITWSNYVAPETIAKFESRTGIKVQVSNYSSNEELLAKLQAGASGYDVAVPSDYMIFAMIQLGLIHPLDFSQLPNSKQVDSRFMGKAFDPKNEFSVPYVWGTTGIGIRRDLYKGQIRGWKDLFTKEDLKGKLSLLDDAREVIGAALKAQGYSVNSRNVDELKKAQVLLKQVRGRIKAFTSEPKVPLMNGEIAVSQIYMSDALQARRETGGKVDYVIPEEGGTFWVDSLIIPRGAAHLKEAHELINFFLEGSSVVSTVEKLFVAPTSKDAVGLLPQELRKDPLLFPPPAVLSRCEMLEDIRESLADWDRVWVELKAQKE